MTPNLLLTRRALLRSAAGAVVVASLPFGLRRSDLRPLPPETAETCWELQPLEQLVVEATAPADRECVFEAFGALDDVVDDVPFFTHRVFKGLTLWTVIHDRAAVVVRCPGAAQISAVVVAANFGLKHPAGVSFRQMELEEEDPPGEEPDDEELEEEAW